MKRFTAVLALMFLLVGGAAYAASSQTIMGNQLIGKAGSSVYVINLADLPYKPKVFTLQLTGLTCYYARPLSGATISVSVATTDDFHSQNSPVGLLIPATTGVSMLNSNFDWIPVVQNLEVNGYPNYSGTGAGTSVYTYPFTVFPGKALLIKADNSGATDVRIGALELGYRDELPSYRESPPMPIKTTYSAFGLQTGTTIYGNYLTGTSIPGKAGYDANLIPPTGTRWVRITALNDTVRVVYDSESGVSHTWVRPSLTQGEDYPVNVPRIIPVEKYIRSVWVTSGVTNGCLALDWYVDEPR